MRPSHALPVGACLAAAALTAAAAPADDARYAERYAGLCAACHGAQGTSTLAATPSLGAQPSFYAITQLFLFREGRRDNPAMTAIAKSLTDDDLRGFSDHIATLPAPAPARPDVARAARGAELATRLHCSGCHGDGGAGGRQVARLAGQREDYLLVALKGFRAATRLGYTPAMSEALAGTAPAELEDLAHYFAGLGKP